MSTKKKLRVVSLFSGAGCFDIGFETAGFETVLTTDIDKDCCKTIQMNRSWTNLHGAIENISSAQILNAAGLKRKELDLLIGGPPCQPYSKSSFGSTAALGYEDERASTVNHYIRVVRDILPKVFIIENVPQFISGKNVKMKDYLERAISRINRMHGTKYVLTYHYMNTADYGIPQIRQRLFIIASRNGVLFKTPEPKFFAEPDHDLGMRRHITAGDAIGHLAKRNAGNTSLKLNGKWKSLLETIPAGSNYLWHTSRGGGKNLFKWRSRFWNFLLKLHPDKPSWTIAAQPGSNIGPFHWDSRRLTVTELQLLQTIPADYKFHGGIASVRKQIGNGVPSAMGELLGKEIRRQFFLHECSTDLLLIPKVKRNSKYLDMSL